MKKFERADVTNTPLLEASNSAMLSVSIPKSTYIEIGFY